MAKVHMIPTIWAIGMGSAFRLASSMTRGCGTATMRVRANLHGIHKGGELKCEAANLAMKVFQVQFEGGISRRGSNGSI